MFDLPSHKKLSEQRDDEFPNWLDSLRQSDVGVVGATPAGFVAGIVLCDYGSDVVLMEQSEQLGGRLLWESGPVPILSPADELLQDLGFPIESNPPVWIDRINLLDFLLHRFLETGGRVVPGCYLDSVTRVDGTLELSVRLDERRDTLETENIVVTDPRIEPDNEAETDADSPLESMVLNTIQTSDGWVSAGFHALPDDERDEDYPFVNAECLSGRKAAELVISGE